jgi:hypothetical protein
MAQIEQQRVLGVIGRRYHADFRLGLARALRNKNGFIRAQAAAVVSRLTIDEKNRLRRPAERIRPRRTPTPARGRRSSHAGA